MNQFVNLMMLSLKEELAKKTLYILLGLASIVIIFIGLYFAFIDIDNVVKVDGNVTVKDSVLFLQTILTNSLINLMLFISIFISSGFITTILDRGYIDIILSKPLKRSSIILARFLSGVVIILFTTLFITTSIWLITSLKFGSFDLTIFWIVPVTLLVFMLLYSILILLAVLTRSSLPGLITTYFIFIILSPVLFYLKDSPDISNVVAKYLINFFYHITPKTSELFSKFYLSIIKGEGIINYEPVITSIIYLIFMLALSIDRFSKKDL